MSLKIVYRKSHLQMPLIALIQTQDLWAKFGLEVDLELVSKTSEAERKLIDNEVNIVIGNHVTPLASRLKGHPIIYLGQATNKWVDLLVTIEGRTDISKTGDLAGKRIAMPYPLEDHPGLIAMMYLERSRIGFNQVSWVQTEGQADAIAALHEGRADAMFIPLHEKQNLVAKRLKLCETLEIPMICGTTITSLAPFARQNPELIKAIIKTISLGIHIFKNKPDLAKTAIKDTLSDVMGLDTEEAVEFLYQTACDNLENKLYPRLDAIANVYHIAQYNWPELKNFNPLSMWDLHLVQEVDEEGFYEEIGVYLPTDQVDG